MSALSDISFKEKQIALINWAKISIPKFSQNRIIIRKIVLNTLPKIVHFLVPILSIKILAGIWKIIIKIA